MVTPVDGDALQGLIQRDQLVNVRASSTAVEDARGSAVAAIDGDPGTTWVADPDDKSPTLSVSWLAERTVRSVRVTLDRQAAGAQARRVVLEYPGGRQSVELDDTGTARVDPFRTTRLDIRLEDVRRTTNRLADGKQEKLGVGVSELRLGGTGLLPIAAVRRARRHRLRLRTDAPDRHGAVPHDGDRIAVRPLLRRHAAGHACAVHRGWRCRRSRRESSSLRRRPSVGCVS